MVKKFGGDVKKGINGKLGFKTEIEVEIAHIVQVEKSYKMSRYHEDLALRLLDIKLVNDEWQDLTRIYGTEVATELRKIAPSDPSILYDLSVISLMDNGMTEKQAIKTVDDYSPKDWQQELEGAKPIITKTIEKMIKIVNNS